jgi:gliding motility-associated-like protein
MKLGIKILIVCLIISELPTACSQCLVSHYKLDGNSSDSVGTNHGSSKDVTYVSDRFGNPNSAARFIASDKSYILLPTKSFQFSNYSYSVWIKLNSLPPNGNAYIFFSVGSTGGDQNMQIENNQDNATLGYLTGFTITAYNINGFFRGGAASGKLPKVGEWNHVVCTRDTNYFKIYVNGCLMGTSKNTNGSLPFYGNGISNSIIGARNNLTKFVDADMDDVKVFNCALDARQIAALYNNFKPLSASRDTTICLNTFKPFKIKAFGKYCSYKWIDISNRKVVLSTDSQMTVSKNTSATYRVFNHLGDSATVVVKISNAGNFLPKDTFYCQPFSRVLNANTNDSCFWSTGEKTKSITINTPGKYVLSIKDKLGCTLYDTFDVKQYSPTTYTIGKDTWFCTDFRLVLRASAPLKQHLWSDGSKLDSLVVNTIGTYYVKTFDYNNCPNSDTINILKHNIPDYDIGKDTVYCNNFNRQVSMPDSVMISKWNGILTNQKIITINQPGKYVLDVVLKNGCKLKDSILISQVIPKAIGFNDTIFRCLGDTAIIRLSGFKSYKWCNGSIDSFLILKNQIQCILEVIDSNGCSNSDTLEFKTNPYAVSKFNVIPDFAYISNPVFKINNQAKNYDSIRYDFDNGYSSDSLNPYIRYSKIGQYTIRQFATNQFGCNDTSELNVKVFDDYVTYYPNAFSPNNDGSNDVFMPYLKGIVSRDYKLQIFNRWGELIFETDDVSKGWDGTYRGEDVQEGNYLYIVQFRNANQIIKTVSGVIQLLR